MCLGDFLEQLFLDGQVGLPPGPDKLEVTLKAKRRLLQAYEEDRWHLPGDLAGRPPYHADSAEQAALWLSTAALCVADRSIDAATLGRLLAPLPLPPADPAAAAGWHYSADLTLRHLPQLYRVAGRLLEDDPLLGACRELAERYPLAAPGLPGPAEPPPLFLTHPLLGGLYVERVLRHRDLEKARHPFVLARLKEGCGAHADLLATALPGLDLSPSPTPPAPLSLPLSHGT